MIRTFRRCRFLALLASIGEPSCDEESLQNERDHARDDKKPNHAPCFLFGRKGNREQWGEF